LWLPVLLGKSKCGATVFWLLGGVAPLLILLELWFFSFFVYRFIVALSSFKMTACLVGFFDRPYGTFTIYTNKKMVKINLIIFTIFISLLFL